MSAEIKKEIALEIAHVLFIDIVHRAANRRFRTSVKDQRHAVASGNFNQTLRRLRFLKLQRTVKILRGEVRKMILSLAITFASRRAIDAMFERAKL
jgi:hypothetical protein